MITNIRTFICVADDGSFSKAADHLFLSPNAVKKRIDYIEDQVGCALVQRTTKGVRMTRAGVSFYKDACRIVQEYEAALARIEQIRYDDSEFMRIGMMEHYADEFLLARKFDAREQFFGISYSSLFYPTRADGLHNMLSAIGTDLDVAVDIYDSAMAEKYNICCELIDDLPICCAVQNQHPLAEKERVSMKDLNGRALVIPNRSLSGAWQELHQRIAEICPDSEVLEIDSYTPRLFCNYLDKNVVFLLTEDWKDIYPFLTFLPLDGGFHVPFGIYFSQKATEKIITRANKLSMIAQAACQ